MERQKVVASGSMTYRIVAAGEEFYALQCAVYHRYVSEGVGPVLLPVWG